MKDAPCEWVVIQYDIQPAILKCLRCGEIDRFPFNKPLMYAVKLMEAFIDYHKDCKEIEMPINNDGNKEK